MSAPQTEMPPRPRISLPSPPAVQPPAPTIPPAPSPPTPPMARWQPPAPAPPRRPMWPIVLAIAVVLALIAVGVFFVVRGDQEGTTPGTTPVTDVPPPAELQALATTPTSVTVSWTSSVAADVFLVSRDGAILGETPGDVFAFEDTGVLPETDYRYTVQAVVGGEASAHSSELLVRTPAGSLATAIVDGYWNVRMRLTSVYGFPAWSAGDRASGQWTFFPRQGGNMLRAELTAVSGQAFSMKLRRRGAAYVGTTRAQLSNCMGTPVTDSIDVRIRVTGAGAINGQWRASRFVGTVEDLSPSASYPGGYCPESGYSAGVTGRFGG